MKYQVYVDGELVLSTVDLHKFVCLTKNYIDYNQYNWWQAENGDTVRLEVETR